MSTNQEEKPAKPRTRSRKSSEQRNPKAAAKAQTVSERVKVEAEPVGATSAAIEDRSVDVAQADLVSEVGPVEAISAVEAAPVVPEIAPAMEKAQQEEVQEEKAPEAALNGEVLPPEVRDAVREAAGFSAIAQAYGEYTRKSWLNGRFLVERLMAMRSFDEAIEIQGEFAKQAYTNFIVQSERVCVLYGEWALGFFRPFEQFAAGWPRIGR
jgi:phasin protein